MSKLLLTQTVRTSKGLRITCRGELDLFSSKTVLVAIRSALVEDPEELVVDLRGLFFCDQEYLRSILAEAAWLRENGRKVDVLLDARDERVESTMGTSMGMIEGSVPTPGEGLNAPLIDLSSDDVPVVTVRRRSDLTEITCVGPLSSIGFQKMIEAVERDLVGGPRTIVFDLTRVSPILSGSSRLVSELASTCLRAGLAVEIKGNFSVSMPDELGVSNG